MAENAYFGVDLVILKLIGFIPLLILHDFKAIFVFPKK